MCKICKQDYKNKNIIFCFKKKEVYQDSKPFKSPTSPFSMSASQYMSWGETISSFLAKIILYA